MLIMPKKIEINSINEKKSELKIKKEIPIIECQNKLI